MHPGAAARGVDVSPGPRPRVPRQGEPAAAAERAGVVHQQGSDTHQPVIGAGEPVSAAAATLEKSGAALVHVDGKPAAVLTRQDLLAYYAAS